MSHDVFVSHSSLDKLAADAVCHGLEAKGVRCWMAPRDQIAGKPFGQQITEAIQSARVMVLVFSEHVNTSQAVLNEIHIAADANVIIVPFRIAGVEFNPELRYYLGRTHWLDAFPQPVDSYIDALAATVQRNLPQADGAAAPAPAPQPALQPAPQPGHPATQPPPQPRRQNHTGLIVLGMVFVFVLLVVYAGISQKRSPAQDQAANVVAQAVANAIETEAKDDEKPPSPPPPATQRPPQDVPY